MDLPHRSKEGAMCHGFEWEMLMQARAREVARRSREKAEAESRKSTTNAPPKPVEAPVKDRIPEPV
jgi:hypothetical protein